MLLSAFPIVQRERRHLLNKWKRESTLVGRESIATRLYHAEEPGASCSKGKRLQFVLEALQVMPQRWSREELQQMVLFPIKGVEIQNSSFG